MIYQGQDLIISANGQAVAASKSCSVEVSCDTQKVSSPDDGQWEHSIPGRKKWAISTNQLMISRQLITRTLTVTSYAENKKADIADVYNSGYSYNNQGGTRGISVCVMDGGTQFYLISTYDTYTDSSAITSLISTLNSLSPSGSDFFMLCSNGQIKLTADIKSVLVSRWSVNANDIPDSFEGFGALSLIGSPTWGNKNIFNFQGNEGAAAVGKVYFNNGVLITEKVLKDSIGAVGSTTNIRVNVPGFVYETLRGKAIIKSFKVSGAKGNLLQGSFAFEGTGPLQ